eukprot:g26914.t1
MSTNPFIGSAQASTDLRWLPQQLPSQRWQLSGQCTLTALPCQRSNSHLAALRADATFAVNAGTARPTARDEAT